jgi:hypothetical protein
MAIIDLVATGEVLLDYAGEQGVALPVSAVSVLRAARGKAASLAAPGADRDAFFDALSTVADSVPLLGSSLRHVLARHDRLLPLVADANALLAFAASNAKKLDDENRRTLVFSADAVARGAPSVKNEQDFLKAYELLTTALAPVTAETLAASQTRLPTLQQLFSKPASWKSWKGFTLGRFVDAIAFLMLLVITCIALAYQSVGSESMSRLNDLDRGIVVAKTALDTASDADGLAQEALERVRKDASATPQALEAAQANSRKAKRDLEASGGLQASLAAERQTVPARLWKWSQQPCGVLLIGWALCSGIDKVQTGKEPDSDFARVAAARTTLKWMNEILLPLLLGGLGSYAFLLRRMTADLDQRSLAKSSTLRHITRLLLGALAGIASSWLLAPETVSGQLKNVPAWVLAFVAGYSIELVFAFMDRFINAFSLKPAS